MMSRRIRAFFKSAAKPLFLKNISALIIIVSITVLMG